MEQADRMKNDWHIIEIPRCVAGQNERGRKNVGACSVEFTWEKTWVNKKNFFENIFRRKGIWIYAMVNGCEYSSQDFLEVNKIF